MILGIVGAEGKKFSPEGIQIARLAIRQLLLEHLPSKVVSGACHLGGIDVWAIEEARQEGILTEEFPPKYHDWATGYKPRNLQIVKASDVVACITVARYWDGYVGMRFPSCYHCLTNTHIKSGGCWTMKEAVKRGKVGQLVVVEP
jgi:hypothetical protein